MPRNSYRLRSQHGFTMMELIIAMTIGLIVAGLIGGIYVGSKKSSRYQETTARLQEQARFATDNLSRAIRNAGWNGCGSVSKFANVVNGGATNWWLNLAKPVVGYEGGVSTFPTEITNIPVGLGHLVSGTDGFIAVGIDNSNELSVTSHNANSAVIHTTAHSIQPGAILVITDCAHTAVFQMSGPTNSGGGANHVDHNTGAAVSPGNCFKGLYTSCGGTESNYTFRPGATLAQLTASAFYIGTSKVGNKRSLWTVALNSGSATTAPIELVEGVEDMQIEYGEDTDSDGAPERYVVASAVTSWPKVTTMRVSLLLSTLEDNVSSTTQKYDYNGATGVTAPDRRVRRTYTSVFTLRNRSQ